MPGCLHQVAAPFVIMVTFILQLYRMCQRLILGIVIKCVINESQPTSVIQNASKRPILHKKSLADVPGPPTIPIFGSCWLYTTYGPYTYQKLHEANEDKFKRYGLVVKEEGQFNVPIVHLFGKHDILKVLRYKSIYPYRPSNEADVYYRKSRPDLYSNMGMANENGPKWKELRSLLGAPLLNRGTPHHYALKMNIIGEDLTSLMNVSKDGETGILSNVQNLVYRASLETVCMVALERRVGCLDPEVCFDAKTIMESIRGHQEASNEAMFGISWWKYVPKQLSWVFTRLVEHKDNLFQQIGSIVDEAIEDERFKPDANSILGQLLAIRKLDIKDIKNSVIDYITAGVDTIGNTVIFTLALISKHPEAQKKLQLELDALHSSISAAGGTFEINFAAMQKMKYLKACVEESFRLYPTASQLARILEVDTEVTGSHLLPKGTVVLCHHRLASWQEDNFTRASEFVPERWLSSDPTTRNWTKTSGLVVPFGKGKRMCPGKKLAEQEIYIFIAKIFHAFDVELLDELDADFNYLLTPSTPLRMKLRDRTPQAQM